MPVVSETDPLDSSPLKTAGWALFLGASWTWCIGMFFPVLLIREFGFWGWIVFALPNVIGSAIAGSVLQSAERSKKLLSHHAPAGVLFSVVTLAFHVFFVGWMVRPLVGIGPATGVFLLAGLFYAIGGKRRDLVIAAGAILLSLVAIGFALAQPLGNGTMFAKADPSPSIIALVPVCMIGFFLCPYLDLTYHRARQHTEPAAGAKAFQLGFFGPFFLMILFTLLYANWLDHNTPNRILQYAIGGHMIVQIALTMAFHVRSVMETTSEQHQSLRMLLPVGMLIGLATGLFSRMYPVIAAHDVGETIYLCFMGAYGAFFPAYVLLCMIPTSKGPANPDRAAWRRVILVTAMVFPCYWMGLIEHRAWWLLLGALILLVSRKLLSARSGPRALT